MALYRSPDYQIYWTQFKRKSAKQISKTAAMAPSWISDRNDFSSFLSTGHPDASTKFGVSWPFGPG